MKMKRLLVTSALVALGLGATYSTGHRALELSGSARGYVAHDAGHWSILTQARAQGHANPGTSYTCPNRPTADNTQYCANTKFVAGAIAAVTAVAVTTPIALPNADIFIGNTSNIAIANSVSGAGDCPTASLSNAGVLTLTCTKTNGVTFGTLATTTPIAAGVTTALGIAPNTTGGFVTQPVTPISITIGTTTIAMATGAITSGTCTSAQTGTITGAVSTDTAMANFAADYSAVTGIAANTAGNIYILGPWVTTNTVTMKECNSTGSSITPGAHSIVVKVVR